MSPQNNVSVASDRWELVNDVHSALNQTWMRVCQPDCVDEVCEQIGVAGRVGAHVSLCGGRHAMGGQQFVGAGLLLDLRKMNRILEMDCETGRVRAEGGIQWPELVTGILEIQQRREPERSPRWGIAQKQTGADSLSLGGALSANIHGRGLRMGPIVGNVESFTLVDARGGRLTCSRTENTDLFSLAIGGYGLFGVITDVTLQLTSRRTLRRIVRVIDIEDAVHAAERRIHDGCLYGDFQFSIDPNCSDFLTKGVFSAYTPVDGDPEPPEQQRKLLRDDLLKLLTLAHTDKSRAFVMYAQHYLATDGQLYKSDTHQLSEYQPDYHQEVDRVTKSACRGSEMITELYVPPERLVEFLHAAAKTLIERQAPVIYGTIRLIQPDSETVMNWARERFACVVFNLHIDHSETGIDKAAGAFRELIDIASEMNGSYYLTYHRFATPHQLERCYPRVREFFAAKREFDPGQIFQSDWYRHYSPCFDLAPETKEPSVINAAHVRRSNRMLSRTV